MLNLILAGIWLVAAGLLYFFVEQGPAERGMIPISWWVVCLILAVYNLARWGTVRLARSQKSPGEQFIPRRRLRHPGDDVIEPDPNFTFSNSPPADAPQPQRLEPPGTNGISPETK